MELVGVGEVYAALLDENRKRGRIQRSLQEIRDRLLATAEKYSSA